MKHNKKDIEKLVDKSIDNLKEHKKDLVNMLMKNRSPLIRYAEEETKLGIEYLFRLLDSSNCHFFFTMEDDSNEIIKGDK